RAARGWWCCSCGRVGVHLGPQEAGELAGDRGGDDRAYVLASREFAETGREPDLGVARTGEDFGWESVVASGDGHTDVRSVLVGPGGLNELAADMPVAGMGDVAAMFAETGRIFGWDEPGEAHERPRCREASPVEHFSGEAQAAHARHAAIGGEPMHLVAEQCAVAIRCKIVFDRGELSVAQLDVRPVVRERGRECTVLEMQAVEPLPMFARPVRTVAPHQRMA